MLKLKRLSVKKHPMLDCPVDLHFSDGENILVGINGSGKTTLLELIKCCLRGDFRQFKDNKSELELTYQIINDNFSFNIEYKIKKPHKKDFNFLPDPVRKITFSTSSNFIEYTEVDFTLNSQSYNLSIENGTANLKSKTKDISGNIPVGKYLPSLYLVILEILINERVTTHLEHQMTKQSLSSSLYQNLIKPIGYLTRFPEGLDFFYILTETNRIQKFESYEIKDIPSVAFDAPSYLQEKRVSEKVLKVLSDDKIIDLVINSNDLPLLSELNKELNFLSIELSFKYQSKVTYDDNQVITTWEGFKLIIDIDENTTITDKDLSYGEKRFISLMLYLEGSEDVIILDEPINGLHHNLIDTVVDKIYADDKQCFIANQNSTLFDYIDFNSSGEVKEKIIFCNKKDKKMSWRNPSDEEAKELFAEVEKDFMYLGEILRMKNLW